MFVTTEAQSAPLATHRIAFDAVPSDLYCCWDPAPASFPELLAHASDPQARLTINSSAGQDIAGL